MRIKSRRIDLATSTSKCATMNAMNTAPQTRKRDFYMFDGGPGRQYIGQSVDVKTRVLQHHNDAKKGVESPLYNFARVHGWDALPLRILMSSEPITDFQANAVEMWFIAHHDTYRNGLNATVGGGGTTGYKHTKDARERIGLSQVGKVVSEETRAKQRAGNLGKFVSPETRAKQSASKVGKPTWNKGKTGLQTAWNKGKTIPRDQRDKISISVRQHHQAKSKTVRLF